LQLIEGPETILTISDNFIIFDRDAYYNATTKRLNVHEKINDIRTKEGIIRGITTY
jgi:hypothetical protein